MFTTKHFIWIGICILFILIMNHYAKKEDFTLQNACYFFMFICFIERNHKNDVRYDSKYTWRNALKSAIPSIPYLQYLIVYCGLHHFWKGWSTKTKNDQLLCGCRYLWRKSPLSWFQTYGVEFNVANVYQCFMYHATLTWFSLYLIRFKHANLGMQAFKDNLVVLFALLVFNLYMNSILAFYDTNFMFIVRPPLEGLPFLNLNHGYYIYLFRVIMLGVIGLSLFHLPFIVKERKSCETESDFNIA